mmetsp:Transcript_38683/g.65870  ORF Transcript_38683/g.65870 Transcript_38683/m.65870 type:complete len:412 (+) Transcript_38683:120-1355(+)
MKADRQIISLVSTLGVFVSVLVAAMEWHRWDLEGSVFVAATMVAIIAAVAPEYMANMALASLAAVGYGPRIYASIRAEDGPYTILSQMRLRIKEEAQVVGGLKALLELTDSDSSKGNKETTGKLLRLGLLQVLTEVLETYREQPPIVVRSLTILRRISTLPDVRAHFEAVGGAALSPIIAAMACVLSHDKAVSLDTSGPDETRGRRCAEVHRLGALIFGALCDNCHDLQTVAVDEGLTTALLAGMDWFRHHEPLAQWALWALFNVTFNHASNKVDLVRRGGLKTVVTTMSAHSKSVSVQRQAVAVLFSCLMNEKTLGDSGSDCGSNGDVKAEVAGMREVAYSQGMNEAVAAARMSHPNDKPIQAMGRQILEASGGSCGGGGCSGDSSSSGKIRYPATSQINEEGGDASDTK